MPELIPQIQQAFDQNDSEELNRLFRKSTAGHSSFFFGLWNKALDQKKYDLVDVFMAQELSFTKDLAQKMIQSPLVHVQNWINVWDRWEDWEEKEESWGVLHAVLGQGASPEVLKVVFHSQTYRLQARSIIPLPWLSFLVHSRSSSSAPPLLPPEEEDRLRKLVWKDLTPIQLVHTIDEIAIDAVRDLFRPVGSRINPPVPYAQALLLWEPEIMTWDVRQIEEFLDQIKANKKPNPDADVVLSSEWSEMICRLEKEALSRRVQPQMQDQASQPKPKI